MQLKVTKCLSTLGRGAFVWFWYYIAFSPNKDKLENNTEIPIPTPRADKAIAGIGAISEV
jgi:hypothetical protein